MSLFKKVCNFIFSSKCCLLIHSAIIINFLVIFGYYNKIYELTYFINPEVPTKFLSTILSFISIICALIIATNKTKGFPLLSLLSFASLYSLSLFIFDRLQVINLSVLFNLYNFAPISDKSPNIPSLGTILCFSLIFGSYIIKMINEIKYSKLFELVNYIVVLVGVSSVLGHIFGIKELYFYFSNSTFGISLPTAISLVLISLFNNKINAKLKTESKNVETLATRNI